MSFRSLLETKYEKIPGVAVNPKKLKKGDQIVATFKNYMNHLTFNKKDGEYYIFSGSGRLSGNAFDSASTSRIPEDSFIKVPEDRHYVVYDPKIHTKELYKKFTGK